MSNAAHRPRLEHIDGLRGIAALMVLYQHLLEYVGSMAPAGSWVQRHLDWTLDYFDLGKLGVVAFFAISGFIVPYSFAGTSPRLGFVISRFFRLYPAYWLSLLVAIFVLPMFGASMIPMKQALANATMLPSLWHQEFVLGVYWTLTIELAFYAMCFALFCFGKLYSTSVLAGMFTVMLVVAMIGAVLRSNHLGGVPAAAPLYLAVMLYAACMRLAIIEGDRQAKRWSPAMLMALLLAIPVVWATAYTDHSHKESVMAAVLAMDVALLLFLFTVTRRAFSTRALGYAGAISYSIYLFHPIALEAATFLAAERDWPVAGFVLIGATLAGTFLGAALVYRLLERPAIRLGRHVQRSLSERAVAHYDLGRI